MSESINPADYGVLPTGFSRMRLPEIRQAIIDSLQSKTQLTFETRPDSITGQFIDVFAEREAAVWEFAEAVYHAMYPISAFGVNLDHSVAFAGVTRLFAQKSISWVNCYGVQDTIIPGGAIVRDTTNRDYILQQNVTIDANACGDIWYNVDNATLDQTYTITLTKSGEPIIHASYVCATGDTNVFIAQQLGTQLLVGSANYVISYDGATVRAYRLDGLNFKATKSNGISVNQLGTTGLVAAINYGPMEIASNTITTIITTQDGWDSVNNVVRGQSGRFTETDDQLRLRYPAGVYRLGAATIDAIKANIIETVMGLVSCAVYENVKDVVDEDGRPPHSIEVVAYGGDPNAIANEIFRLKAAGIDTFGTTTVTVSDVGGYRHDINFNRPLPIYVWVTAQITLYDEETFPANGDTQIANIIVATGNTFEVGKDILHQRFHGPIYSRVNGIASIVISTAVTSDPTATPAPGAYTTGNKVIAVREVPRFLFERVTVLVSNV